MDLNKVQMRHALRALAALAAAPEGFPVADLAAQVRTATGLSESDYSVRQAAYDLRKLRGKDLLARPGRTRRYRRWDRHGIRGSAGLAVRMRV